MSVKAKATIKIEIDVNSNWNDETTVSQVKKQAIDDAKGVIRKLHGDSNYRISIIGEPDITVITFDA
jgi:hypothetical protein